MTGEPAFRQVVEETLDFVTREMLDGEGGFYSSLDADSEGEEGKFYLWTAGQIRQVLGEQSKFFEMAYGISEAGNWEGLTVLQRAVDDETLGGHFALTREQVLTRLRECHARLLQERSHRVRPAADDKMLAGWNGLMLRTFAEAGRVLGNQHYQRLADRNADFLLTALCLGGSLRRAWRKGQVAEEVFLEDYAALILGLLELYQSDFNLRWFREAINLAQEMLERFSDPAGGFFDTPTGTPDLLIRPKDLQDNATPSGNALAAEALLRLAALDEKPDWREFAERSLRLVAGLAPNYPTAFAHWLGVADFSLSRVKQVALIGEPADANTQAFLAEIFRDYRPNTVWAAAPYPPQQNSPAILANRPLKDGKTTAYVCENFVCQMPVTTVEELRKESKL